MAAGGNWKEMFHASETGDFELVNYHLKMGVDPNYQHPEYMTGALLESIRKGNLAIAELLLNNGANPSIVKVYGTETPMSIAEANGNKAAIYLLNAYLPEESKNKEVGPRSKVLITDGHQGIGKAMAKKLLLEGQKVVLTTTSQEEGNIALESLKLATKNPNISFVPGDLSTIQGCYQLIEKIKMEHPDLNVLINHAGVWMTERKINVDGLESNFMANYLAPYLLCKGLFLTLKNNKPARIVNISAGLHTKGKFDFEKIPYGFDFSKIKTAANTKLCHHMFMIDFSKEIEGSGVTINALHSGIINANVVGSSKLIYKCIKFIKRFSKSSEYAVEAASWLAIDEKLSAVNGKYYHKKEPIEYIDAVKKIATQNALRSKTEEIINKNLLNSKV